VLELGTTLLGMKERFQRGGGPGVDEYQLRRRMQRVWDHNRGLSFEKESREKIGREPRVRFL
jgi:hypothetical protein